MATIRDCMARSPAPWPQDWQQEYLETIREAIGAARREDTDHARRLQILREGFRPCWEGLAKNRERFHFEVRRAQIRWYVENLMAVELPSEEQRQAIRRQYEDLADHAARSLLAQFSFLDPNRVEKAKLDHLAECYRNIEAPLLPIFLIPLSEGQMEQIEQRWHDLRYARVDLWRQLGGKMEPGNENREAPSIESHPDYLLTEQSLSQLRPHIWAFVASPPEYYRTAVANEIEAQRRRAQTMYEARSREMRVPLAVRQTEYLSFLLTALLETAEAVREGE